MTEPGPMGEWSFHDLVVTLGCAIARSLDEGSPPASLPPDRGRPIARDDDPINDWIQAQGAIARSSGARRSTRPTPGHGPARHPGEVPLDCILARGRRGDVRLRARPRRARPAVLACSPPDWRRATVTATRRQPWTVRVATWSARHRWPVFGAVDRPDHRPVRGQPGDGRHEHGRRRRRRQPRSSRPTRRPAPTTCSAPPASRTRPIGRCSSSGRSTGTIDDPADGGRARRRAGPDGRPHDDHRRRRRTDVRRDRRPAARPAGGRPRRPRTARPSASPRPSPARAPRSTSSWPTMRGVPRDDVRAAHPGPAGPLARRLARQRGHPGAGQRRPGRLAPADDPADVPHPAHRLRGGRRRDRAARPGGHRAPRARSACSGCTARCSSRSARTPASSSCSSAWRSRSTTRCS